MTDITKNKRYFSFRYVLAILLSMVLGVVGGYLLYNFLQTEDIILPTQLTSQNKLENINLKHAHKLTINDKEIGIGKNFVLNDSYFNEGKNTVILQRVSFEKLKSFENKYFILADRLVNEPRILKKQLEVVINQSKVSIPIEKDAQDILIVNDTQVEVTNDKIDLKLNPGENTFIIKTQDPNKNISKATEIKIINDTDQKWKTYSCSGFKFSLDSTKNQVGFSGVNGRSESQPSFVSFNNPEDKCKRVAEPIEIFPVNQNAPCWNCDYVVRYISANKSNTVINRPTIEDSKNYPYVKEAEVYTTKSGITGDLLKTTTSNTVIKNGVEIIEDYNQFIFTFLINDEEYNITGNNSISNNVESDFMSLIDTVLPLNIEDKQENNHTYITSKEDFSMLEKNSFKITAVSDWKVEVRKVENKEFPTYSIMELKKGTYKLYIQQTPSRESLCGLVEEYLEVEKFKQIEIDGLLLSVPQVTLTKSSQFGPGNFNDKVYFLKGDKVASCDFGSKGFNYMISITMSDAGKPVSEFDEEMELEINEILKSIKW
jgi:hypothetical protein